MLEEVPGRLARGAAVFGRYADGGWDEEGCGDAVAEDY